MSSEKSPSTPTERVEDLPRILRALRKGTRQAMQRHRQAGVPVAVWRDGAVVWLDPDEIPIDEDDSEPRRDA